MTDILDTEQQDSTAAAAVGKLADRVAFVTGGTRGIGAAIALSLASQGASVAVGHSRPGPHAEQFLAELTDACRSHGAQRVACIGATSAPPRTAGAPSPR